MGRVIIAVFVLLCCATASTNAQNTNAENIRFSWLGSKLVIKYDIVTKSDDVKTVPVSIFVLDSVSNKRYLLTGVTGDAGSKVFTGSNRQAEWDSSGHHYALSKKIGVQILHLDNSPEALKARSAGNILRSVVIPGWGTSRTFSKGKGAAFLITAAAWGSIGYGLYNKQLANKSYDTYMKAVQQDDIDAKYNQANTYHHNYLTFTRLGAAIWAADILFVSARVISKKSKANKYASATYNPRLNFAVSPVNNGFTFTYSF